MLLILFDCNTKTYWKTQQNVIIDQPVESVAILVPQNSMILVFLEAKYWDIFFFYQSCNHIHFVVPKWSSKSTNKEKIIQPSYNSYWICWKHYNGKRTDRSNLFLTTASMQAEEVQGNCSSYCYAHSRAFCYKEINLICFLILTTFDKARNFETDTFHVFVNLYRFKFLQLENLPLLLLNSFHKQ